jgi:hypothetical protein
MWMLCLSLPFHVSFPKLFDEFRRNLVSAQQNLLAIFNVCPYHFNITLPLHELQNESFLELFHYIKILKLLCNEICFSVMYM